MSHIATVKVRLKDRKLLAEVCRELGIPLDSKPRQVQLYSGAVDAVASFQLKGWSYPVAVQADGTAKYDNYGGRWGDAKQLHRVLQRYSERIATREARRMGMAVRKQQHPDGTIVFRLIA